MAAGRPVTGLLAAFSIARDFNQLCGGTVIAPWELNELSEDWHIARRGLRAELQQMQTATQKIEALKNNIRTQHARRNH